MTRGATAAKVKTTNHTKQNSGKSIKCHYSTIHADTLRRIAFEIPAVRIACSRAMQCNGTLRLLVSATADRLKPTQLSVVIELYGRCPAVRDRSELAVIRASSVCVCTCAWHRRGHGGAFACPQRDDSILSG